MVRLYVGGLSSDVTPLELAKRFESFGEVQSAEVAPPKQQDTLRDASSCICRGFGYVDVELKDEKTLARCLTSVGTSTSISFGQATCQQFCAANIQLDSLLGKHCMCVL